MAETGIVATIKGKKGNSSKSIGLRADIDALPIEEKNDFNHKSREMIPYFDDSILLNLSPIIMFEQYF